MTSNNELSLYTDPVAGDDDYRRAVQKLTIAFCWEDGAEAARFAALMVRRMKANGFSSARVRDAVNNVIDNFRFKTLNIADVVAYDRKVKAYTWREKCRLDAFRMEWLAPLFGEDGGNVRDKAGNPLWIDVSECMGTPYGERGMAWIVERARREEERERARREEEERRGPLMNAQQWREKNKNNKINKNE